MHYLLKDSPARRQIYEEVTGAAAFPISFCKTRWCESEICAKRPAEIWTDYTKFIQHLTSLNKSAQPTGKSFDGLKAVVNTPLMCARFRSCETLSWKLNEYLRGFQNDKPLLPFVQESLLRWLLGKLVLQDVLDNADTTKKLTKLNVDDVNILKPGSLVNVGHAAK